MPSQDRLMEMQRIEEDEMATILRAIMPFIEAQVDSPQTITLQSEHHVKLPRMERAAGRRGASGGAITSAAPVPAESASYTGPLDLVPGAVVAYGQRALSAAKRGTALYTIRRDSDDTEQSFNSNAVTGDAPVSSIQAFIGSTFQQTGAVSVLSNDILLVDATGVKVGQLIEGADIPANTYVTALNVLTITISNTPTGNNSAETLTFTRQGYVTVWNDQSGNNKHLLSIGGGTDPKWVAVSQGGKPAFTKGVSTTHQLDSGNPTSFPNGKATAFCVFQGVVGDTGNPFFGFGFNNGQVTLQPSGNSLDDYISNSVYGAFDAFDLTAFHLLDSAWEIGNNTARIDGAPIVVTPTDTGSVVAAVNEIATFYSNNATFEQESICYSTILSDANRLAIRQNIGAYYWITL